MLLITDDKANKLFQNHYQRHRIRSIIHRFPTHSQPCWCDSNLYSLFNLVHDMCYNEDNIPINHGLQSHCWRQSSISLIVTNDLLPMHFNHIRDSRNRMSYHRQLTKHDTAISLKEKCQHSHHSSCSRIHRSRSHSQLRLLKRRLCSQFDLDQSPLTQSSYHGNLLSNYT